MLRYHRRVAKPKNNWIFFLASCDHARGE